MKKLGWKFILLVLLAVFVFLWLVRAPIVSSYLTRKIRVPVSIEWMNVGPHRTRMHNFQIENPRGFSMPVALLAESTEISYDLKELLGNPTVISQIVLNGVFVGVEYPSLSGSTNNWTLIGDQMPEQKSNRRVMIHSLVLMNVTIEISGVGPLESPMKQKVERMEFTDLDSAAGFPTELLIEKIFGGSEIQEHLHDAFTPDKQLKRLSFD